ncbi:hypothetical protein [Burkholderia perseverans]|uniref:hypothetical protein n=1 Tax=Burkholderia perseverans TaxID=2615214 RepID=UPI001FEE938C|nr:hypothetical protein [Burkholderia perseverans]
MSAAAQCGDWPPASMAQKPSMRSVSMFLTAISPQRDKSIEARRTPLPEIALRKRILRAGSVSKNQEIRQVVPAIDADKNAACVADMPSATCSD